MKSLAVSVEIAKPNEEAVEAALSLLKGYFSDMKCPSPNIINSRIPAFSVGDIVDHKDVDTLAYVLDELFNASAKIHVPYMSRTAAPLKRAKTRMASKMAAARALGSILTGNVWPSAQEAVETSGVNRNTLPDHAIYLKAGNLSLWGVLTLVAGEGTTASGFVYSNKERVYFIHEGPISEVPLPEDLKASAVESVMSTGGIGYYRGKQKAKARKIVNDSRVNDNRANDNVEHALGEQERQEEGKAEVDKPATPWHVPEGEIESAIIDIATLAKNNRSLITHASSTKHRIVVDIARASTGNRQIFDAMAASVALLRRAVCGGYPNTATSASGMRAQLRVMAKKLGGSTIRAGAHWFILDNSWVSPVLIVGGPATELSEAVAAIKDTGVKDAAANDTPALSSIRGVAALLEEAAAKLRDMDSNGNAKLAAEIKKLREENAALRGELGAIKDKLRGLLG